MPDWWAWTRRWRSAREQRILERRAIGDDLWSATIERYAFIASRPADEQHRLRALACHFLDQKEFHAVRPLVLTDEMAVAVAAQACLPVLELGLGLYDGFVGIVMQAGAVRAPREEVDDAGVVHEWVDELSGEATDGGPLMLSWQDVHSPSQCNEPAYNVVIHEFAHVLDLRDGVADGVPLLPSAEARQHWQQVLQVEYDQFCERVVCGHNTAVDPYGAEAIDEFFAVACEAFFVTPQALQEEQPAMYRLLQSYYRQDPTQY